MGRKKKQPWGILLNVIVLIIAGALTILGALVSLGLGVLTGITDMIPFAALFAGIAIMLLVIGGIEMILAYGLLLHKDWAWWILVILGFVSIIFDVLAILGGTISIVGMILGVILLLGLLHRDTIKAIKPNIEWKGWKT